MTSVAVVVVCFNHGRTIEATVASIVAQNHPAAEVVVIDDGADEPYTLQALARIRGTGVRVVSTPNRGVAAARNLAVSLTSAPYVVVLDGDDLLESAYIERLAAVLDARTELDFVTTIRSLEEADSVWSPPECTWIQTLARGGPHVPTMFRRVLWSAVGGFDPALAGYEDLDFWLSALERCHQGVVVADPFLRCRVRGESRYRPSTMGADHVETMAAIYRKHPPATADQGRRLLLEKEAFLSDQRVSGLELSLHRSDIERTISGLRSDIAVAKSRLDDAGLEAVDFGDLRRTAPISPVWGLDRGGPLDRHYIGSFLARHRADISGCVLEVKDSGYTTLYGGTQVTRAEVIDIDPGNVLATVIADLAQPGDVPADRFDCFVCTQTLHMVYDTRAVLRSAYRLLKPGGVLLCTVPCVSRVDYENNALDEGDFWRFTPAAMRALFAEVFPVDSFDVESYGNVLTCAAFLHGLAPHEVGRQVLDSHDPAFPLLCSIRAVKPLASTVVANSRVGRPEPGTDGGVNRDASLVLLYHRVGLRTPDVHKLCVDSGAFRQQMRHLRDHYCPLPLEELVDRTLEGTAPPRAIAVTLDDGYLENLEVVSPILREFNIPATFFLNTAQLDDEHECWWDVLERVFLSEDSVPPALDLFGDGHWVLATKTMDERATAHRALLERIYSETAAARADVIDRLVRWCGRPLTPRRSHRPMTVDEIIELAAQPGHAIGAHTVNHLSLARQPQSVQLREIAECKATLERLVKRRVRSLAYPYGDFSGASVAAARDSGLDNAVTVDGRLLRSGAHRLMVPRREVTQRDAASFAVVLEAAFAGL